MSIAYLITQKEIAVLHAMVKREKWTGDPEDMPHVLDQLTRRGYVFQKNKSYTIERVIYGLIKAIEKKPEEAVLSDGENKLYKNPGLWIFLEKDPRSKTQYKLKPFPGKTAFEASEEGQKFSGACSDE